MRERLQNLGATMQSQWQQFRTAESAKVKNTLFDYDALVGEAVRTKSYELELRDIAGDKSLINITSSMQLMMLISNYGLASNHDVRKNDSMKNMTKTNRTTGLFIPALLSQLSRDGVNISHRKMFKALFVDSLPDVFTGLREASPAEVPSALVTALVNGALNVFVHAPLQAVQALMQVMSMPTSLVNYCYNKAKPPKNTFAKSNNEGGLNNGWLLLAGVSAVVTLPFQLFSIAANTIGYTRHVIDSGATMSKAIVNLALDSISIVISKRGRVNTTDFKESVEKASGQLTFALKDFAKNLYKLAPIVLTGVLAFFSGGLTLAASSLASTVAAPLVMPLAVLLVSPLLTIACQALSAVQIAIPKTPFVSNMLKKISNWGSQSKEATSIELTSFNTPNKNSSQPELAPISPALSTLSQGAHTHASKDAKSNANLNDNEEAIPLMAKENLVRSSTQSVEAKSPTAQANDLDREIDELLTVSKDDSGYLLNNDEPKGTFHN